MCNGCGVLLLMQVSPISERGHSDPVMALAWVFDPSLQAYALASLGADGKVQYSTV